MLKKILTGRQLLFLTTIFLVLIIYLVMPKRNETVIRLHDDQVEIQILTNAIAEFIITEGYDYQVELVESTIKEIRDHILNGDIDITLELWKENNLSWYNEGIAKKLITDLGPIYNGGKQYWIVSKWYAEEKGIKSVFDMRHHWKDFVDPDDPSKGLFFNCIFGWTCLDINSVKLQAYGLDKYYNTVSPVSPESLKAIYVNAQARRVPVFGYYWEPNSIMTGHDWFALEEPAYSEAVWEKVISAATNPNSERLEEACAFKASGVNKIVHKSLIKKAPEVYGMLKKMEIDRELLIEVILSSKNDGNGDKDPQILASQFLQRYPDVWLPWVPENVRVKIVQALEATGFREKKR